MRKAISVMVLVAIAVLGLTTFRATAHAEEFKFIGVITRIEMAGNDAKTATVTLKDNDSGNPIVVTVNDDLTLDKYKDHRIVEGDEIRCKYEVVDGKNVSKLFRKTAGC